jgi:Carboxypeptidase regulatory-like domain
MTCNLFQKIPLLQLLLICANFLSAQQLATLNVTVTDPTGSLVPGAHVMLSNPGTGLVRTQVADHSGFAVLTALSAGDYRLVVQADGFSDYERPLTLTVGQVASVSAQLGLAARETERVCLRVIFRGYRYAED